MQLTGQSSRWRLRGESTDSPTEATCTSINWHLKKKNNYALTSLTNAYLKPHMRLSGSENLALSPVWEFIFTLRRRKADVLEALRRVHSCHRLPEDFTVATCPTGQASQPRVAWPPSPPILGPAVWVASVLGLKASRILPNRTPVKEPVSSAAVL